MHVYALRLRVDQRKVSNTCIALDERLHGIEQRFEFFQVLHLGAFF